jgi:hypothetical protein
MTVMVDVAGLGGEPATQASSPIRGRVPPETVRRIACDATVSRVMTMGAPSPWMWDGAQPSFRLLFAGP